MASTCPAATSPPSPKAIAPALAYAIVLLVAAAVASFGCARLTVLDFQTVSYPEPVALLARTAKAIRKVKQALGT